MNRLVKTKQMSEALLVSLLLAFSGGFQDAYTYVVRDHVFANAQTGNIVLMSTNLMEGNISKGIHYLIPLISFLLGVILADIIREKHPDLVHHHWRQSVLLLEMLVLGVAGFVHNNVLSTSLVSFSCAMQVQAFRKVNRKAYASTMCIGNIRAGASWLTKYMLHRNSEDLVEASDYFLVILFFALGAGIGGVYSNCTMDIHGILWTLPILCICYMLMRVNLEKGNK